MLKDVIIFPTDTVYGIGASLYDTKSIEEIYSIKGRDFNKQIAVLCSSIEQIEKFAVVTKDVYALAEAFWPGSLTLILKTNEKYFEFSGERTIGVRIPNHKKALKLINKYGPLKTTSINQSGKEPLNDYYEIKQKYGDLVKKVYNNKEEISKVSSTVISLVDNLVLLRQGDISLDEILKSLS